VLSRDLLLAVVVLTLVPVACGSDRDPLPEAQTPAHVLCEEWATVGEQITALTSTPTDPSHKARFDATGASMRAIVARAPTQLRGDFEAYAKFWADYTAAIAKANYDTLKAATDPEFHRALDSISDEKLQRASSNITAWMQRNCPRQP
jgi:hypothetical protein